MKWLTASWISEAIVGKFFDDGYFLFGHRPLLRTNDAGADLQGLVAWTETLKHRL